MVAEPPALEKYVSIKNQIESETHTLIHTPFRPGVNNTLFKHGLRIDLTIDYRTCCESFSLFHQQIPHVGVGAVGVRPWLKYCKRHADIQDEDSRMAAVSLQVIFMKNTRGC